MRFRKLLQELLIAIRDIIRDLLLKDHPLPRERDLVKRDLDEVLIDEIYASHEVLHPANAEKFMDLYQPLIKYEDNTKYPVEAKQSTDSIVFNTKKYPDDPIKLQRWSKRWMNAEMEKAPIGRAEGLDSTFMGKYSFWRRNYNNFNSDSTLKLMHDQISMANAYATIAKTKDESTLYDFLMKCTKDSLSAIGEANSDADLQPSALGQAKAMGEILTSAKDKLLDCAVLARKQRAMIQVTVDNVNSLKEESAFLIQLDANMITKPIHCLSGADMKDELEDPSLYHYAIFSDNVLAAAVILNSNVVHANEPEKHVFHIVTDKSKVSAMKMWFRHNTPSSAIVEVLNIDDFTLVNSSYCPVLQRLESARLKELYFKPFKANNNPSSLSTGTDQLKYRNPKYLSMLKHFIIGKNWTNW